MRTRHTERHPPTCTIGMASVGAAAAASGAAAPAVASLTVADVAAIKLQALWRGFRGRKRADFFRRQRRGEFQGRIRRLGQLLARRRYKFVRDGASARIAHAWRVHRFRERCKHGLSRT
jgi:hypothetical protein